MTKREVKRLRVFISEHKDLYRSFRLYLTTQQDEWISPGNYCNKPPHKLITETTLLDIPFNQIKKITFCISTRYNIYYF